MHFWEPSSLLLHCRGLEKALDQIEAERNAKAGEDAAAIAKAAGIEVTPPPSPSCHLQLPSCQMITSCMYQLLAWQTCSYPSPVLLDVAYALHCMTRSQLGTTRIEGCFEERRNLTLYCSGDVTHAL